MITNTSSSHHCVQSPTRATASTDQNCDSGTVGKGLKLKLTRKCYYWTTAFKHAEIVRRWKQGTLRFETIFTSYRCRFPFRRYRRLNRAAIFNIQLSLSRSSAHSLTCSTRQTRALVNAESVLSFLLLLPPLAALVKTEERANFGRMYILNAPALKSNIFDNRTESKCHFLRTPGLSSGLFTAISNFEAFANPFSINGIWARTTRDKTKCS